MANPIYEALPTTIFTVMSGLAQELGAINLGQGFPDQPGPEAIRRRAAEESIHGDNQYPPTFGTPALREAVARHYARVQGLEFDWRREGDRHLRRMHRGAGHACWSLIAPGDEVVLLQPLYDSYLPMVSRAGGVPRLVRLEPPHFRLTRAALEAAFTPKTRLVVLNNPLNPSATVAPARQTGPAGRVLRPVRRAVAVCDEVWEHVVFAPHVHRPLIGFPGMRERAVKIGSAGKMFALTGWKVGFICAAPELTSVIAKAHQFLTFTCAHPAQGRWWPMAWAPTATPGSPPCRASWPPRATG